MDLPYPENGKLEFKGIQKHLRDDVINFMIPLIKDTETAREELDVSASKREVTSFSSVFSKLMKTVYTDLAAGDPVDLGSAWCVSFHRGKNGNPTDFGDPDLLREHLDQLLKNDKSPALRCWRIIRHFSGKSVFIVKPKARRYWLKSAAVRDADEMFAWSMEQEQAPKKRRRRERK